MEQSVALAYEAGVDFIIFGGMTLKPGRQREYFYKVLRKYDPGLIAKYRSIYKDDPWGGALSSYYNEVTVRFFKIALKYKIPIRIPAILFANLLDETDLVIVMLEHLDYCLKLRKRPSPLAPNFLMKGSSIGNSIFAEISIE